MDIISALKSRWEEMLRAEGAQTDVHLPVTKKPCGEVHRLLCPDAAGHALPEWFLGFIFVLTLALLVVLFFKLKRRGPDPKDWIDKMTNETLGTKLILRRLYNMEPPEEGQPPPKEIPLQMRLSPSHTSPAAKASPRSKPPDNSIEGVTGLLLALIADVLKKARKAIARRGSSSSGSGTSSSRERKTAVETRVSELTIQPVDMLNKYLEANGLGSSKLPTSEIATAVATAEKLGKPKFEDWLANASSSGSVMDVAKERVGEIKEAITETVETVKEVASRNPPHSSSSSGVTLDQIVQALGQKLDPLEQRLSKLEQRTASPPSSPPPSPPRQQHEDPKASMQRIEDELQNWDEQQLKRYILDFNPYVNGAILDKFDREMLIKLAVLARSGEEFAAEMQRITALRAARRNSSELLFAPAPEATQIAQPAAPFDITQLLGKHKNDAIRIAKQAGYSIGGEVEQYNGNVASEHVARATLDGQIVKLVVSLGKKPWWKN
jgi:hypothetical protein